jgi:exosortase A-associated hydrolase 1
MTYTEQPVVFPCHQETLVGAITAPQSPSETGVLVIVGGPQYRVGSHRQFVVLARHLASHGFAVLRFDCRGMGDSSGAPLGFEATTADISAAIEAFQSQAPGVRRIVLWGLCDGASAALLYFQETSDARVGGLCLLNPWIRSTASLARTHVKHYYGQRLLQAAFWTKLLRGQVGVAALAGAVRNTRDALFNPRRSAAKPLSFQSRMAAAWSRFPRDILLLLSGDDYTAREFLEFAAMDADWLDAFKHPHLKRHDLAGADHTFSRASDRARVEALTLAWLQSLPPRGESTSSPTVATLDVREG